MDWVTNVAFTADHINELSQLTVPDGVICRDPNCKSRIHQADISGFHDSIICTLTACSQPLTVPNNRDI